MNKTTKTTIWIVVVVVLVALGWQLAKNMGTEADDTMNASEQPAPMAAANDASDSGLEQDGASIDAQLQALDNDSANADQSMNDKPVSQE